MLSIIQQESVGVEKHTTKNPDEAATLHFVAKNVPFSILVECSQDLAHDDSKNTVQVSLRYAKDPSKIVQVVPKENFVFLAHFVGTQQCSVEIRCNTLSSQHDSANFVACIAIGNMTVFSAPFKVLSKRSQIEKHLQKAQLKKKQDSTNPKPTAKAKARRQPTKRCAVQSGASEPDDLEEELQDIKQNSLNLSPSFSGKASSLVGEESNEEDVDLLPLPREEFDKPVSSPTRSQVDNNNNNNNDDNNNHNKKNHKNNTNLSSSSSKSNSSSTSTIGIPSKTLPQSEELVKLLKRVDQQQKEQKALLERISREAKQKPQKPTTKVIKRAKIEPTSLSVSPLEFHNAVSHMLELWKQFPSNEKSTVLSMAVSALGEPQKHELHSFVHSSANSMPNFLGVHTSSSSTPQQDSGFSPAHRNLPSSAPVTQVTEEASTDTSDRLKAPKIELFFQDEFPDTSPHAGYSSCPELENPPQDQENNNFY